MLLAENFLEQAVAKIFDGKPAGTRMALEEIAKAWKGVGLRRTDLRDALEEMVERHCLLAYCDKDNLSFELTERGAIRFYVCLYCEDNLQARLGSQRELQDKSSPRDGLVRLADRRSRNTEDGSGYGGANDHR